MKNNALIYISLIGLVLIGFLGFNQYQIMEENRDLRSQLVQSRNTPAAAKGGKQVDPYIAGPVKNRIVKGRQDLKACYNLYLETTPAIREGKIKLDWQIDKNGRPSKPEVVFSQFSSQVLGDCLSQKISEWRFPEPIIKTYVSHLFRFNDVKK